MYTFKCVAVMALALMMLMNGMMTVTAQPTTAVNAQSTALAAILYEPSSGRVLFEKNAHTAYPMASTTKLMTALVAYEQLPQDAVLTVTAEAIAVEGSSMGLCAGDTVSRDDLLCGLLLSSGNDAANVLALSVAGSYEAFAEMMNTRAEKAGMTASHFVTPSGLDAEGHGASAYDMALLSAEVLRNETLAAICAMPSATVSVGSRQITLRNHNKLLTSYEGAVGMKTGYTSLAGRCLVSAAERDGVTLIAVTLNCADDWREHTALLDEGFALTERVTLSPPLLANVPAFGGVVNAVELHAAEETVTLLRGETENIQIRVTKPPYVWAPIRQGDTLGTVEYTLRGTVIARTSIVAAQSCEMRNCSFVIRFEQLLAALFREALT